MAELSLLARSLMMAPLQRQLQAVERELAGAILPELRRQLEETMRRMQEFTRPPAAGATEGTP